MRQQLAGKELDPRLVTLAAKLPEDFERDYPRLALEAARDFAKTLGNRDDARLAAPRTI